ncbi:MAG: hypothetical protein ACPG32_03920 [Akkermansiaceae bacterium]
MFSTSQLTPEQTAAIQSWVADGAQLADIQKRMESELGHRLTYMDTRFLVLDLNLEIKPAEEEAPPAEDEPTSPDSDLTEDDIEFLPPEENAAPLGGGRVSVTVDGVARPGVMVSGRVTFPDNQSGMWYVDEMGRLGLDPDTEGYRPSEADLVAFQKELQQVMENQ